MATSSILGGTRAPQQAAGRDAGALGPSDSSDSGSDVAGDPRDEGVSDDAVDAGIPAVRDSDTDAGGTGERAGAIADSGRDGGDILPDSIRSIGGDDSEVTVSLEDIGDIAAEEDDEEDEDADSDV